MVSCPVAGYVVLSHLTTEHCPLKREVEDRRREEGREEGSKEEEEEEEVGEEEEDEGEEEEDEEEVVVKEGTCRCIQQPCSLAFLNPSLSLGTNLHVHYMYSRHSESHIPAMKTKLIKASNVYTGTHCTPDYNCRNYLVHNTTHLHIFNNPTCL